MVAGLEDILIEVSPGETRAAFVDSDGRLVRFMVERSHAGSRIGGIYRGRVTARDKVSGGAFVDIDGGDDGAAFLARAKGVHEGQALTVQVLRDGWAGKSAVVTRSPVIQGRYLHWQAGAKGVQSARGVRRGRALGDLTEALEALLASDGGRISIQPAAIDVSLQTVLAEASALQAAWAALGDAAPPACLIPPLGLAERLLRDHCPAGAIYTDDRACFTALQKAAAAYPDLKGRIVFHDGADPLFEAAGVEDGLADALSRTITLAGGRGRITFDTTEALTAIDIDSAGAVQGGGDAVRRLNLAAMAEIAHQIVLRDIAGLIVIDPVSMKNRGHARQVVEALRTAMKADERAVDVLGMSAAGLIEATRQRRGPSLAELMLAAPERIPGPAAEAEAARLLRAALRLTGPGKPLASAGPDVIAALQGPMQAALAETERRLGQPLALRADDANKPADVFLER